MIAAANVVLCAMMGSGGVGSAPRDETDPNIVGTTVGVDGATIAWSLGYARAVPLPIPRLLLVSTQFTLPMAQPDFGDWRWTSGLRIDILAVGRFAWPLEGSFVLRRLSNRSVSALGVGTELATMPGWYPKRWFVAAEISWDHSWGSNLQHSDAYRDVVYEDVKDGWYRSSGFTMRYGGRVGGRPWKPMEVWLRAGYEQHGRFDIVAPPLYALIGVNFRF